MFELRVPLLNATTDDVVYFGPNLYVRPATELELNRWSNDPFVRDVVPHRVLPAIKSVVVSTSSSRFLPDESHEAADDLMVWFGLASLWMRTPIEASFCEEWYSPSDVEGELDDSGTQLDGVRYFTFSLPVRGVVDHTVRLDGLADGLRTQILKFRSEQPNAGTFRFVLARWYNSLNRNRRSLEDAILDLSIALESLFILDAERGDKAKLLRERIGQYWCGDNGTKKDMRTIKKQIDTVYRVRSRIIHGQFVDGNKQKKARTVLEQLTRTLLCDFAEGRLNDFDPTKYWMPSPETSGPCKCTSSSFTLADGKSDASE